MIGCLGDHRHIPTHTLYDEAASTRNGPEETRRSRVSRMCVSRGVASLLPPFSSWLSPSQTPQSARREDEREAPEPAERPEYPDEKEAAGGPGDLAVVCSPHVHDRHRCREQPDE